MAIYGSVEAENIPLLSGRLVQKPFVQCAISVQHEVDSFFAENDKNTSARRMLWIQQEMQNKTLRDSLQDKMLSNIILIN